MKKFTTDHISKIIQQSSDTNSLVAIVELQKELTDLWETVTDPVLKRMDVELYVENNVLTFACFSSVALNYLRRKKIFLEHHFASFMSKHHLERIEIIIGEES